MANGYENNVRDTAFIVCCNRAKVETLCGDKLAKYWIPASAWKMHTMYAEEVTPYDDLLIGLRFKFFLDQMNEFFLKNPNGILVNIAAGFSSYAYFPNIPKTIEVECEEMSVAKQSRAKDLISRGILPTKDTIYLSCDLSKKDQLDSLKNRLVSEINNRPSFFLLEGLLYYLKPNEIRDLFEMIGSIQKTNEKVGLSAWRTATKGKNAFKRYLSFVAKTMNVTEDYFTFLDLNYFQNVSGYSISIKRGFPELAKKYEFPFTLEEEDTEAFTEDLYILEKY